MFAWLPQNRLYTLAHQAQRKPHILLVIFIAVVIVILSQFGITPLITVQIFLYGFSENGALIPTGNGALVSALWMAGQLISAFIGIFILIWLWLKFYEKRPFTSIGLEKDNALLKYLRGFALGILIFAGAVGILASVGFVTLDPNGDPSMQGIAALSGVLIVLLGWIVQGAAEEVLTRGWMLPILSVRYKPWVGILVSSIFFAILHSLIPNLSLIAMLNLALFGLFAAFYALREGSIWGICALHTSWNWVQGNIFGLQVSGGELGGGSLLNLQETGPDWFTGGNFGPEGGLAVTIMLLVGILVIFFWPAHTPATSLPIEQE